ncbi:hypothetical protein MAR_005424 [Mya arenaria]|uniref:Protein quiver n=1 Tax=Mya arenaria TaxID=6604 RepID=A0ABY7F3G0_MYAAR|nr:uncharacterized protein LOC128246895 isoform X2 [Mya arenaria]WAR15319.1 hypothetical protein MAR_005424 [Mya arenaria]
MDKTLRRMFLGLLIVICSVGISEGLMCYFCGATGGHSICEDPYTYIRAKRGKGDPTTLKNCTYPYDEICVVERFSSLGSTVSEIRDCSDGRHFSYTSNLQYNRSAYERLEKLMPNNETACVWDGLHQVCLTKCDTDFCNGPQYEVDGGMLLGASLSVMILSSFLQFITFGY